MIKQIVLLTGFLLPLMTLAVGEGIVGVGLALDKSGTNFIKIGQIVTGSPASENPELRPGLIVRSVYDGQHWINLQNTTMERATKLMRGQPGTIVKLKVSESDSSPTQEVTLERRDLKLPETEK